MVGGVSASSPLGRSPVGVPLPIPRARCGVEQDEMHGPPLGVHSLRRVVGGWPTAREREDEAGVVRAEPSLDRIERVGCEAVDRTVRRTGAVHAARSRSPRSAGRARALRRGTATRARSRRRRAARTAVGRLPPSFSTTTVERSRSRGCPSIRSMPATVRASRSRGGSKSPKPASASAAPSSSAPMESSPASKRSSSGPTSSTPMMRRASGETPPLELGTRPAGGRRPPPHERLVLEGLAVELHALGSRQLVVTHHDGGHELAWQSFPQEGIDALRRERVVDDLQRGRRRGPSRSRRWCSTAAAAPIPSMALQHLLRRGSARRRRP